MISLTDAGNPSGQRSAAADSRSHFPQPVARQNSAADGHLQAEDRFHKGTFAGAVFSHDAEVVARKDLKIKVLQNGLPIVADAELLTSELSHHPTPLTQCLFQHGKVLLHHGKVGSTVCSILGGHGLHGVHGQHLLVLPGGALDDGFRELVVLTSMVSTQGSFSSSTFFARKDTVSKLASLSAEQPAKAA